MYVVDTLWHLCFGLQFENHWTYVVVDYVYVTWVDIETNRQMTIDKQ